ncbi:MAG: mechanosensitive ion channel family protein [Paenibacillaceae bacterium]|nr:mechanosensitive ion channel family protein [Paenibacillaceae bacterium]
MHLTATLADNLMESEQVQAGIGYWTKVENYVTDPELWSSIITVVIKIIVIWIVGRLVIKLSNKAIDHMTRERERNLLKIDQRRSKTISRLVGNVVSWTVNFITLLLVLSQMGFNLGPLLAGAGVLGLAIGFGAQSLVKDVITGFFIIFEDQFAVGDVIQIGAQKGTVEQIGLRVTRIRSALGEEYIIPNGSIGQVTNFSVHNATALIDILVPYKEDAERVVGIINETLGGADSRIPHLVAEPKVLGVQTMAAADISIRVEAECEPNTDAIVARMLNAEIKQALDAHGIRKAPA